MNILDEEKIVERLKLLQRNYHEMDRLGRVAERDKAEVRYNCYVEGIRDSLGVDKKLELLDRATIR